MSETPEYELSDEQLRDLERRLANQGPVAADDDVEAFFERTAKS